MEEEKSEVIQEAENLLTRVEQKRNWDGLKMCLYKGFWCPVVILRTVLSSENNFKAHETDIILATMPRSGTVWLKALTFAIANRHRFSITNTPLLVTSPHLLIPFLEFRVFKEHENPYLDDPIHSAPRIFATHLPRQALPNSIITKEGGCKCKIIYICRNPLDQFISFRHFLLANQSDNVVDQEYEPLPIDEALEMFCQGTSLFGPFWDHVLGYWNMSLVEAQRVLFLKYEDLKEDIFCNIKKIAEFIGLRFSEDEEKQGVIEEIEKICSFESLKSSESKAGKPGVERTKFHCGSWKINGDVAVSSTRCNHIVLLSSASSSATIHSRRVTGFNGTIGSSNVLRAELHAPLRF
ncbi:hypothetical protein BUALT_Bualt05G0041200 [Buddleja alternifolia]|uniref:Sulfotransferase n=1 Tax=Buddleja alternifolia TaxID=168488 RepID=A0AAV6XPC7_9LAMI|nr:hypothetical protein BUALT_Bualt05G0041200 [Buddleja alternifolia]